MSDKQRMLIVLDNLSKAFLRLFHSTVLIIICGIWLTACTKQQQYPPISISVSQSLLDSLIWITDELGYFEEQGITLELHTYPSGKRALAALMRGEHELATTAETPFVIASFKGDDLCLFATIGQSDNDVRLLARRDHGIHEPTDLAGKVIATQEGSAVHYFLSSFLLYHQLDSSAIKISFMKAEKLPDALAKGDIDAFSMREPFLAQAKKTIGIDKLVEFSVPGLYTKSYNLVGDKNFVSKYPGAMKKILVAVNKAADYADKHPQKAMEMIVKRFQFPLKRVTALWSKMRFKVTLNQNLLTVMEEEAEWLITTGRVNESDLINGRMPNFRKRINPLPLAEGVPYAVGLIGLKTE